MIQIRLYGLTNVRNLKVFCQGLFREMVPVMVLFTTAHF